MLLVIKQKRQNVVGFSPTYFEYDLRLFTVRQSRSLAPDNWKPTAESLIQAFKIIVSKLR